MQQPTDPTKQQNASQEAPEQPDSAPAQPVAPQSEPVLQQPSQAQPDEAFQPQQPAYPRQEIPYAPAPQQDPYAQQAYRQTAYQQPYQQTPYRQTPSPYPAAYPMSDFDRTLRMVAFILNMVSLAVSAVLIIPLAWMIPMCITSWRIYKGTRPNTTAFGVCTLIFVSLFGGILLLISKKDR